jgi:hypothetical protein
MARENATQAAVRVKKLNLLQTHYKDFIVFLQDVMELLGFSTTEIQVEIGNYLVHGPQYLMVQAQRGQAKTTIAAAFAVWCLIHSPAHRVLVLSAGGTQAGEIAILIIRIILTMDVLECMRPDKTAGDRTATDEFDLHHSIKGLDKSPSVACVGIDANLQGKRADLLIADDVESTKNSATAVQRAKLLHITKDFASIADRPWSRVVWLGTPQTMESIYNALPARGVQIRIWPGRYPTAAQRHHYGLHLSPTIVRKMAENPALCSGGGMLGDQGQPVDPVLVSEEALQIKELNQGAAYFQLQHMLNTALTDAARYPLSPLKLTVLRGSGSAFPMTVTRGMLDTQIRDFTVADHSFRMMAPHEVSIETTRLQSIWAYIDPAAGGANADETAWAIGGFLNGNIHLLSVGGMPGGYTEEKMIALAKKLARFKLDGVTIEKNMGYGAFAAVFTPILRKYIQCQIEEDLVTGQKETRIINTLAPIMGRGALIIEESVIEEDQQTIDDAGYAAANRQTYSLFFQLAKLSAARNSLIHDDRADSVEGLCRHFGEAIAQDQKKNLDKQRDKLHKEAMKDPLKHNRFMRKLPTRPNMLRHKR